MLTTKEELLPANLLFYKITGFWTTVATNSKSYKRCPYYFSHLTILFGFYFTFIIVLVYDGIIHTYDIVTLINKVAILITTIEAALKAIYIYNKRENVKRLYPIFKTDFLLCKRFNETESNFFLRKAAKSMNFWGSLLVVAILCTGGAWTFYPLISVFFTDLSNLKMYPTWYPVDVSLPLYRILCYIFEGIITMHNSIYLSTSNGYILIVTFALDAQIQILKTSLKNVSKNLKRKTIDEYVLSINNNYNKHVELLSNLKKEDKKPNQMLSMDNMLRTCIIDHKRILQMIGELENIYSPLNLCQMIISLVTICLLAVLFTVQISSSSPDSAGLMQLTRFKMLLYIGCVIAELFLICWSAHTICDQAEKLCDGFYATDWPMADKSFRTNINTAMMRCRKPIFFTAGKFCAVNLFTFTSIMKASYSYFSVLYNFISSTDEKI